MSAAGTVLVTGGGSGIGAGLAAAFHERGATVVIAGRTRARLDAVAAHHPGMAVEEVDIAAPDQIAALGARMADRYPALDTVISNAGIQRLVDFAQAAPLDPRTLGAEIDVNLTGLIAVAATFVPLLKRQPSARLIHVGSGLGYVPLTAAPIYSATKAAVHSFTISLRRQLKGSPVRVIELIPPVVETELHRGQTRRPPRAMALDAFVAAAMAGIDAGKDEIPVGLARLLRAGSRLAPGRFLDIINRA